MEKNSKQKEELARRLAEDEKKYDAELEHSLYDRAVCIDLHLLLGGDDGAVRNRHHAAQETQDAELIYPAAGLQPVRRNIHLPLHNPKAYGLGEQQDGGGEHKENRDIHLEDLVQGFVVPAAELGGVVAVAGRIHHPVEEGKGYDYASDDIVEAEVGFPEG